MPVYTYKAIDADDGAVVGEVAADTPRQARDVVRARGLTVERMDLRAERAGSTFRQRRRARRYRAQTTAVIGELSVLLGAGIPLVDALTTLVRQHGRGMKAMILALREDVAAGRSLAEAMARRGGWFDETCVSIARVGESAGALEKALARLAEFRTRASRLRSRVATALVYPAIVSTVGLCVMVFLMTYVVPGLLETLAESQRPLPTITRAVKAVSDFLLHRGWLVVAVVVAVAAGGSLLAKTASGRRALHRLLLRLPLVGELIVKETVARISVVLASLLESGVVFVEAVAVTRRTTRNVVFREALRRCEQAVGAGRDIAAALESAAAFPPLLVHMCSVGQQSGELEAMLRRVADAYEQEVELATARLAAAVEPALIILLAVMVGLVAFATILPILEASDVL